MVLRSHKWYLHGLSHLLGLTVLGIGLMVVGCGSVKPFEPPQAGEIPDGPGLFTGSKGALVLSRASPQVIYQWPTARASFLECGRDGLRTIAARTARTGSGNRSNDVA